MGGWGRIDSRYVTRGVQDFNLGVIPCAGDCMRNKKKKEGQDMLGKGGQQRHPDGVSSVLPANPAISTLYPWTLHGWNKNRKGKENTSRLGDSPKTLQPMTGVIALSKLETGIEKAAIEKKKKLKGSVGETRQVVGTQSPAEKFGNGTRSILQRARPLR